MSVVYNNDVVVQERNKPEEQERNKLAVRVHSKIEQVQVRNKLAVRVHNRFAVQAHNSVEPDDSNDVAEPERNM